MLRRGKASRERLTASPDAYDEALASAYLLLVDDAVLPNLRISYHWWRRSRSLPSVAPKATLGLVALTADYLACGNTHISMPST
jgi:hypothetical protein